LTNNLHNTLFAVLDVETTGGRPSDSKITDISIYITDGKEIKSEFSSLVNPEKKIDPFVIKLTGITNDMVANEAPFRTIAQNVSEILKDKIIVAHNADFDFQMLQKEFLDHGLSLPNAKFCTVKAAKKALPNLSSYSLGNLCDHLNISHENAHRAQADALATTHLFHHLLKLSDFDFISNELKSQNHEFEWPSHWEKCTKQVKSQPGIIYFYSKNNEILDIFHANNLKKGLFQILDEYKKHDVKYTKMVEETTRVDFEYMHPSFKAEIKVLNEIQTLKPKYSKPFKQIENSHILTLAKDELDLYHFKILKANEFEVGEIPFVYCTSVKNAEKLKKRMLLNNELKAVWYVRQHLKKQEKHLMQENIKKHNDAFLKTFTSVCCPFKEGYYIFKNVSHEVEAIKVENFYITAWISGTLANNTIENQKVEFKLPANPKFTRKFLNIVAKTGFKILKIQ
jgi:DNA polymerase-3 subunit epsilon